jgi:hypothetical protein
MQLHLQPTSRKDCREICFEAIPEGHAEKLKNQLVLSLKYMSSRDPSGRNKYLLWSAKYLVNQLAKYMEKRTISREAGPNFGAPTVTPRYLGDEDPEDVLERFINVIQTTRRKIGRQTYTL